MKIRSPMHSIDARGKFGASLVFAIWRGLNYLRCLTIPANPQTLRQMRIRGFLTGLARSWAALDEGERSAWRSYALLHPVVDVFGQSYYQSGFNWYVGLNTLVNDQNLATIDTPPIVTGPGSVLVFGADEGDPGEITASWTPPGAGTATEVQVTGIIPIGRVVQENQYRHSAYVAGNLGELVIENLVSGAKYGVRARKVLPDGQPGPWSVAVCVAG